MGKEEASKLRVYLTKPDDFNKRPRYEILKGESLDKLVSTFATVRADKIPDIDTHLIITAHSGLGGGLGGWDPFQKNLRIIETDKYNPDILLEESDKHAREIAEKYNCDYFDLDRVSKIRKAEKELEKAQKGLEREYSK